MYTTIPMILLYRSWLPRKLLLPDLEVIDSEGGRVLDPVVLVELGRQGLTQLVAQTLPS